MVIGTYTLGVVLVRFVVREVVSLGGDYYYRNEKEYRVYKILKQIPGVLTGAISGLSFFFLGMMAVDL